jgi:hypothetical protein
LWKKESNMKIDRAVIHLSTVCAILRLASIEPSRAADRLELWYELWVAKTWESRESLIFFGPWPKLYSPCLMSYWFFSAPCFLAANPGVCCYSKIGRFGISSRCSGVKLANPSFTRGGQFAVAHSLAAVARLATGLGTRATQNGHRLASAGLSPFLALEIPGARRQTHREPQPH